MIVKMAKVFIASTEPDRDRLLNALRELGVIHLVPVDAERAVPDEPTAARLDTLARTVQLLEAEDAEGIAPNLSAAEAADEATAIHRRSVERSNRLTTLYRQLDEIEAWGDVRLDQLAELDAAGVSPRFYAVPQADVPGFDAELVQPMGPMPDGRTLVGIVQRGDVEATIPESAETIDRPSRDRATIQAEAKDVDTQLKDDAAQLAKLANLLPEVRAAHLKAVDAAQYQIARHGAHSDGGIFAVQGWLPAADAGTLSAKLDKLGLSVGIQHVEPDPDEQPPTLIRYPAWARPIKALFGILGTVPGYREYDLAPFFMLAMPLFTAMLVGDAGYGLVFTIIGALTYGKMKRAGQAAAGQMILVFALATVIWGVLTGNYFGVSPYNMQQAGGFWASLGDGLQPLAQLWRLDDKAGRDLIMQISFGIGCIHLVLAHLRQAIGLLPDQRGIAEIGWIGFIVGMFTLVWLMFFGPMNVFGLLTFDPTWTLWLLVISWVVIVLFCSPDRNPVKRVVFGILGNLMSVPGAFGDMLSYIRLMAVGLASFYIASAFNTLGADMASTAGWVIPLAGLVIVLAHLLNIGLCLVAIFAHGVRLNMLEFSTNAGVQWDGYPYAPFMRHATTEGEG